MARWRRTTEQIEPPSWYRVFDAAMWDAPDAMEQRMIDGCPSMQPWPEELHHHHAQRRWEQAKYRYRQAHPDLAEQELADLIGEEARARRRERYA